MKFWKYTSAGNDFVIFEEEFLVNKKLVPKISDRRFGIGADGVLVFKKSENLDFEMVYFNADGGEVEMCGNGARALCHFAKFIKGIDKKNLKFKTLNGIYAAEFCEDNIIKMAMSEVRSPKLSLENLCPKNSGYYEVGVPHVVLFGLDYDELLAKKIRHDKRFKNGTNVNFVKIISENKFEIRTFERGVEAETLACGTGITASGIFLMDKKIATNNSVEIIAKGGNFSVDFENGTFFLTGTTQLVFSGELINMG